MVPKRRQGITTTRCVMTQKIAVLARYVCPILNKTGFARQFFVKVSDITVHGYPSSLSRTDVCRQTDRQTWRIKQSLFTTTRMRVKTGKEMKVYSVRLLHAMHSAIVHYQRVLKHLCCILLNTRTWDMEENRGAIWCTLGSLHIELSLNFYCLRSDKSMYVPIWKEIMFHWTHSLTL